MSTNTKTVDRRAPTHPSGDSTDLDEVLEMLSEMTAEDAFQPEPPCAHCTAAQALAADAQAMCDVHARQSLPYTSPLQHHGPDGLEKQRQDAWILY